MVSGHFLEISDLTLEARYKLVLENKNNNCLEYVQ